MQYELRQYTDSTKTDYTVVAASNIKEMLESFLKRPSVPNNVWYLLHIVDTYQSIPTGTPKKVRTGNHPDLTIVNAGEQE
jgi:hypothetical protein